MSEQVPLGLGLQLLFWGDGKQTTRGIRDGWAAYEAWYLYKFVVGRCWPKFVWEPHRFVRCCFLDEHFSSLQDGELRSDRVALSPKFSIGSMVA